MDSSSKTTPVKEKTANRSKRVKNTENNNPNVSSPVLKLSKTPSLPKSEKRVKNSHSKNPDQLPVASPLMNTKCKESKFLNVKKKSTNEEINSPISVVELAEKTKSLSSCNESLIASQKIERDDVGVNETVQNIKKCEDKVFVKEPEPRFGKVMNLVKAFENLSVLKLENSEEIEAVDEKEDVKVLETEVLSSSFSQSDLFLTSESLDLDPRRSFSLDSNNGSLSTRTSAGGQRRRRSSTESSGTYARRKWRKKQLKGTSQKPFKLRTEKRGRCKEEEFTKKLQQMMEEEEKLRVPIAQGLPITIDEPECLVKPPVKGTTKPVNLVLHTVMRAAERSEFDHQVAKKMSVIEQYRAEKERRQKLEEEEEVRKLRKELVPKAQPMPYFDRPFVPVRYKSSTHTQYMKLEEEEEVRKLRKELVPKAQPIPYFDRPFVPVRSGNNPTLRKEQKVYVS